jgi:uncharacterized radical SAM protein YgiQ
MFLPTTREEIEKLGWTQCDIILVTGDAYIDSPYVGVSVIGHVLMDAGYKVGIIAQPSVIAGQDSDIARLGEPRLFWGVSGGCVDSMVSNYTAVKKPRRSDDFTPGDENTKRPNRAVIAYSNLIKQQFKNTAPIVLGGLEASLRRMAHYDFWQDGIRKSILFDAKADYLVYGMGERAVVELAKALDGAGSPADIRGICYISPEKPAVYIELPSFDEVIKDKGKFIESFRLLYDNNDPGSAKGLAQKQDTRWLVQNPPAALLTTGELDKVYELPYEYDAHPYYKGMGVIKALETIKFSITSHRGCFGECNFCAITTHQGRVVVSRSPGSIIKEAEKLTKLPGFKGYIFDVGGPTANMYMMGCSKIKNGHCANKRCIYPAVCENLEHDHGAELELLKKVRAIKGIKKVFVGSGIRHDMIMDDKNHGSEFLKELVINHVSGQVKLAPEHSEPAVLALMGKPGMESLKKFREQYFIINGENNLNQFLTYYIIAAHPGCTEKDMGKLKEFVQNELKAHPEQVQIFTPTPGTWSGVMYYTETDPFTGKHVFVEKNQGGKERQKAVIVPQSAGNGKGRGHKSGWGSKRKG